MQHDSKRTVLTLSNLLEVATGVVHELTGSSDLAKTVNGERVTRAGLADLIAVRIAQRFARHTSQPITKSV